MSILNDYKVWRENPNKIYWNMINVSEIPLNILREFKDYIRWTVNYDSDYLNFYNILKYNKFIDMDFIREYINGYKEERRFELNNVIGILDSRGFSPKQYRELLRMWVDWNVENKTKGLY